MSHFSRINTIWRKELVDTLRDRRTLLAMVLVPMVLYPALMLGSLQAFELQTQQLRQREYKIGVQSAEIAEWLTHIISTDLGRRPGAANVPTDALLDQEDEIASEDLEQLRDEGGHDEVDSDEEPFLTQPTSFDVVVVEDLVTSLDQQEIAAAVQISGALPTYEQDRNSAVDLIYDETDFRSQIAAAGLQGILERLSDAIVELRLRSRGLTPTYLQPIEIERISIATPEERSGSLLGQIVPFILIVMTITGAIYPAIDLTAGERERGTLETLMVAPVPTIDLIAGKFIVVTLIGMLSAILNLTSVAGTILLGFSGDLFAVAGGIQFPLWVLPWMLVILLPLAIMFSAILLAVCSFARSFKEAQNYVMPVMVMAMIPAVIGLLPGARLEGPTLILPVANIVLLTKDLFVGRVDFTNILWVTMSTSMYAGAAVAVAARLFGQEAVLFADSGSIKTLFQRRFFKARETATVSVAFLLLAVTYVGNYYLQLGLVDITQLGAPGGGLRFVLTVGAILIGVYGLFPMLVAAYARFRLPTTFGFTTPQPLAWAAVLCFAPSTWVLAILWLNYQQSFLPMDLSGARELEALMQRLVTDVPLPLIVAVFALVPAVVEELFYRGFALRGLRGGLGGIGAVLITAAAFALAHGSVHRLVITGVLGIIFGVLTLRSGSIWPAIVAHLAHNGLTVLIFGVGWLRQGFIDLGLIAIVDERPQVSVGLALGAGLLASLGVVLCWMMRSQPDGGREVWLRQPEPALTESQFVADDPRQNPRR